MKGSTDPKDSNEDHCLRTFLISFTIFIIFTVFFTIVIFSLNDDLQKELSHRHTAECQVLNVRFENYTCHAYGTNLNCLKEYNVIGLPNYTEKELFVGHVLDLNSTKPTTDTISCVYHDKDPDSICIDSNYTSPNFKVNPHLINNPELKCNFNNNIPGTDIHYITLIVFLIFIYVTCVCCCCSFCTSLDKESDKSYIGDGSYNMSDAKQLPVPIKSPLRV